MQNGNKTFHRLTSLLLAALLALAPAAAVTASVASAAANADDPKWAGIQPLITEDNYVTRNPDPEAPNPWGAVPDDAQLYYEEQEATLTARTFSASESAGAQATTTIQIKGEDENILPNPQAPANGESFTASHPFDLPAVEGTSAGLEYKYISGSLPYYAAKAGDYTMTVCYKSGAASTLSWSGSNVVDGSKELPAAAGSGKTVDIPFTVSTAGAGTLAFTSTGSPEIEWIAFRLDSAVYIPVSKVTLNKTAVALYANANHPDHTVKLTANLAPAGSSGDLVWSSSNEAVATCDQKGLVTAVGNGTATITVTATNKDGSTVTAQAAITVQTRIAGVSVKGMAYAGQELKAVLDPEGVAATYEWVRREARDGTWTTIAGQTSATYTITEADVGANIFVWATGTDGSLGKVRSGGTALIQAADAYVKVTGVTLPATATVEVGKIVSLEATVSPAEASVKTVNWTSSDESVVKVSRSGVINGIQEGSAVITVTTDDGGFTAACAVTVIPASEPAPDDPTPNIPVLPVASGTTTTVTDPDTGVVTETTVQPDGTVTKTVTDPDGGMAETVTAPNKDMIITVTDPTGEILVRTTIPAEIPELETRFVDVPEGHWADEAIHNIAALGIVEGVGGDKYNMGASMTRGMLATVLFRMSNGSKGYELGFDDVDDSRWYADGIAWAARANVVNGLGDGTFAPDSSITREQLATMLYRYAALLKLDAKASASTLDQFTDGADIHSWAAEGMAWCVENGILRGKGNNVIDPRANATRAEAAVMLQRLIDLMK